MAQIHKDKLSSEPESQWNFLKNPNMSSVDSFSSKAIANLMAQKLSKLDQKSKKNLSEILPSDLFEFLAPFPKNAKGQKSKSKKVKESRGNSLLKRIAFSISQIETQYNPTDNLDALESDFLNLLARGEFVPEISLLKNINQGGQSLTSYYHIPVNNEDILESVKQIIKLYQCGASPYLNLSDLQLNPTSFLQLISQACLTLLGEVTANQDPLALLPVNHPFIFDFIEKFHPESANFPFQRCVGLTAEFLNAVVKNDVFNLVDRQIQARSLFKILLSRILDGARINLVFLNTAQKATSLLFPYETSPQGFINLSVMHHHQKVDWERLKISIHQSVHFLDNVIELNDYPLKKAQEVTHHYRRIGLGVMGFADLLGALKITYGSDESFQVATDVIKLMTQEAEFASQQLALSRGVYPHFSLEEVSAASIKKRHRHLISLTQCPHESQLIGCASSIKPKLKLNPEIHLKMGAVFQKHTDGQVSQEIPLPQNIKSSELASLIFLAFEAGLRSLTFTR